MFVCLTFILSYKRGEFKYVQNSYLQTLSHPPPDSAREELHELFMSKVQKLVQVDSTVGKLTEGPLPLQLSGSSVISHFIF